MIYDNIKNIINDSDSKYGRWFALAMQFFILVIVICFTVETLPNLDPKTKELLLKIETVSIIAFTVEYLLRLAFAEKKLKFVFSFFGIIDLAAILPFYLALGFDLRAIRALRFLRIFSILKFFRYSKSMKRLFRAFEIAKEELILFLSIAIMIIYLSAVGIYFFEHEAQPDKFASILHSMWWALTTLTTVGYGDMFPVTAGGKVFSSLVLLVGLAVIAVPTGLIASALSQVREEELHKKMELKDRLESEGLDKKSAAELAEEIHENILITN